MARQGYFDNRKMRREETAHWMSFLLTAQTGTPITPAQLLGTEEEEKQNRLADAQRDMKTLLRRMRRAGLDDGNRKLIVNAMQAAADPNSTRKAIPHG